MLLWYTYLPFWIVSLFLTDKKVSRVLMCSSIFLLFEKMYQRNCIKFGIKNEIQCARTQVQVCYNRFKEGREDVNDDSRPILPSTGNFEACFRHETCGREDCTKIAEL